MMKLYDFLTLIKVVSEMPKLSKGPDPLLPPDVARVIKELSAAAEEKRRENYRFNL